MKTHLWRTMVLGMVLALSASTLAGCSGKSNAELEAELQATQAQVTALEARVKTLEANAQAVAASLPDDDAKTDDVPPNNN
jgi:outer membrane murein-binding lipoprotein Lpp